MKGLVLEESIIGVHDDLEPWAALCVGFNENREFVIELKYDDRDDDSSLRHRVKQIVIGEKGADKLVARLGTRLTELPKSFAKEFEYRSAEGDTPECWDAREVFDIYHEILNYLSGLDVHYTIKRA